MILFGSRARGEERSNSDIDIVLTEQELEEFPSELAWEHGGMCDVYVWTQDERLYTAFDPSRTDTNLERRDQLGEWRSTDLEEVKEMNRKTLEHIISQSPPRSFPHWVSIPIKNAKRRCIGRGLEDPSTGKPTMIIVDAELDAQRAGDPITKVADEIGVFGLIHSLQRMGYEIKEYTTREITLARSTDK